MYLAWCRGYAPEEVVRLLKLLAKNPLPLSVEKYVRDHTNNFTYYRATMTLKNKQYCVQSVNREVLEKLLRNSSVRDLVPHSTKLQEVTTSLGEITYNFPINSGASEKVKKVCRDLGISLIDEFDFANVPNLPSIKIDMKATTLVRFYQEFAVSRLFWNGFKCHSGILVLPCGAGKTLIGINVVAALKKPCIIYCQSILAVTQWRDQLLRWTTINENSVSRFSASFPTEWNAGADVIVTTYGMFSTTKRSDNAHTMMDNIKEREWGLMLLDEVHLVPAKIFRKVTNQIRSHIKLGLTATMVREDELIADLPHLVGPKLYELDIFTLRMHKYISPVECVELHCSMTDSFMRAYSASKSKEEEQLLYSTNPNKTRVVWSLINYHIEKKHRIMVFCDNLFCLEFYTSIIKRDKIDGNTTQDERSRILRKFRETAGECILFSQVGDQSIDLPEADVVIQVALMHGGRMQEGQRIGRIQRYQEEKATGYFYSLVSDGTREVKFAKKRRNFLQDHGYTIKREKGEAYKKYLTDLEHLTNEDMQQKIIGAVQNELKKREAERTNGKQTQETSKKRKKVDDTKKEVSKRIKRVK
uniref:DNA 3'-5' helicase n=1 Tax=Arcella intermedia TaxID=1963864 RepID=A0A6B2KZC3_9EUKA